MQRSADSFSTDAGDPGASQEADLLEALRRGEEQAFVTLVERYHVRLVRLALLYVPSPAVAEEVAQDAWLGVLRGLPRFEGRSSLRTWLFRILVNRARSRGVREARSIPFSAAWSPQAEPAEPAVDPERFLPSDDAESPGHWASAPRDPLPEERLLADETQAVIRTAVAALPPAQREVLTLRDLDGWDPEEVCHVLEISAVNQRVLLHRARSKVRHALERYAGTV